MHRCGNLIQISSPASRSHLICLRLYHMSALFDSLSVHAVILFEHCLIVFTSSQLSLLSYKLITQLSLSNLSCICSFTAHSLVLCLCPLSLIGLSSSCGHCSHTQPPAHPLKRSLQPTFNLVLSFFTYFCVFSLLICSFLIAHLHIVCVFDEGVNAARN